MREQLRERGGKIYANISSPSHATSTTSSPEILYSGSSLHHPGHPWPSRLLQQHNSLPRARGAVNSSFTEEDTFDSSNFHFPPSLLLSSNAPSFYPGTLDRARPFSGTQLQSSWNPHLPPWNPQLSYPPDYGLPPPMRRQETRLATNPLEVLAEEEDCYPGTFYTGPTLQGLDSSQESSGRGSSSSSSSKACGGVVGSRGPGIEARDSPDEGIQTDSGTDV